MTERAYVLEPHDISLNLLVALAKACRRISEPRGSTPTFWGCRNGTAHW